MEGPLANYVEGIGLRLARYSQLGNAQQDFTVSLLNSPVNNAFAVPGGYICTTRQLVALMNAEAELAAVLGHEVAHVAARHSARRQRTAQRSQIAGVLGAVLSGMVLGDSQIGSIPSRGALPFVTLAYLRDQEEKADQLSKRSATKTCRRLRPGGSRSMKAPSWSLTRTRQWSIGSVGGAARAL